MAFSNEEVGFSVPKRARHPLVALLGCGIGGTVVVDSQLAWILIPFVPAMAFMLWVVCALEKQIRKSRRHRDDISRPKG